jgi:hypothetical protein
MPNDLFRLFPVEGTKILLVLFLSFLIGLEREERKTNPERYSFGGVRTFPLIGLIGYVMALLSGSQLIPVALGFAVVGALLVVSYTHKLSTENNSGVTTGDFRAWNLLARCAGLSRPALDRHHHHRDQHVSPRSEIQLGGLDPARGAG